MSGSMLKRIQEKTLLKLYTHIYRSRSENPSSADISTIRGDLAALPTTAPLQGHYRLTGYQTVDIDSFNAELGLVRADAASVIRYLSAVVESADDLLFVSSVWSAYTSARAASVLRQFESLAGGQLSTGLSEKVDTRGTVDMDESTVFIDDDGVIRAHILSQEIPSREYGEKDISVTPINGEGCVSRVYGSVFSLVSALATESITLSLEGTPSGTAGFEIRIKTDLTDIDLIEIDFGSVQTGTTVVVTGSPDRVKYTTLSTFQILMRRAIVPYDNSVPLREIRLYMTRSLPTVSSPMRTASEFMITSVLPVTRKHDIVSTYVSRKIPLGDVSACALAIDAVTTGDAYVECYVTTSEVDGEASGYRPYRIDGTDLIEFPADVITVDIAPPSSGDVLDWSFLPTYGDEKRLYPVLGIGGSTLPDVTISGEGVTISAESGKPRKLVFADGVTPVYDSARMYRGMNDYSISHSNTGIPVRCDGLVVSYPVAGYSNGRFPLPMLCTIQLTSSMMREDPAIHGDTLLVVPCEVLGPDGFRMIHSSGTTVSPEIVSIDPGKNESTIRMRFIPVYAGEYMVTVMIPLAQYESMKGTSVVVDPSTLVINAGRILSIGTDYIFSQESRDLTFRTEGMTSVIAEYSGTETRTEPFPVYTTYVETTGLSRIEITGFTATELSAGNFHRIDGVDCSTLAAYDVKAGLHRIESTQPFPCSPAEVNSLTGKTSRACMIFPESVIGARAYRDSSRVLSSFVLATLPDADASACVALEGDTVYTAYRPDYIPHGVSMDVAGEGGTFACRKYTLSSANTVTGVTQYPEHMRLEIPVIREDTGDRFIYVQLKLYRPDDGKSSVMVREIGLTKYGI